MKANRAMGVMARMTMRGVMVVLLAGWAAGCSNAAYLYETEKLSLTLEAQPDPNSPISGSLGAKQRIGAVLPPRGEDGSGDAVSALVYFDAGRNTATGPQDGVLRIRSGMVTGAAASSLTPDQTSAAAKAISFAAIPTWSALASDVLGDVKRAGKLTEFSALVKSKAWGALTPGEKQQLDQWSGGAMRFNTPDDEQGRKLYEEIKSGL